MKRYRIGFDFGGLLLFFAIMLPNLIWFAIPAPNDVLRRESVTTPLDAVASVCQMLMAAALIAVVNPSGKRLRLTALAGGAAVCGALYYCGWILYYLGKTAPPVILLLTVPPCLAFLLYAADRRNLPAIIPGAVFTCCHLAYAAINFLR